MSFPRMLATLSLIAMPIVAVADVGSIVVVHMTVPDDAAEAGRAGVEAIGYNLRVPAATPQNGLSCSNRGRLFREVTV